MAAGSSAALAPASQAAAAPPDAAARAADASSRAPPGCAALAPAFLLDIAPIYLVAIAILCGDALGVSCRAVPLWIAASLAALAAALFMRRAAPWAMAAALIALAAAASIPARRAVAPSPGPLSIRNFADGAALTLAGRIERPPRRFPDREYVFVDVERAGAAGAAMRPARGTLRVTMVGARAGVRVGDEVRLSGALRFARDFGDAGEFDYAGYLARQGIAATMVLYPLKGARLEVIGYRREFPGSQIAAARARIGAFIDANLAGQARAEMRALVIGDRGGISRALRQRFARAGLAHMLVISGLHLGLVAAAAFALVRLMMGLFPALTARGWANKAAALGAALAALAYAAIAGRHVSTTRALVMVLAYALAVLADRSREVLASLALAAIVICVALPGSTADIGFQLSFASVLAIVLGMRRFAAWRRRRTGMRTRGDDTGGRARLVRAGAMAAGYVAVSFWALLGVAPLTARDFNQFSAVGVIANAVVVPLMASGGVVCGLAACALGMVAPALAAPLIHIAGWALDAGTWLAGWFVRWPAAYFRTFTPTPLEVAVAYGFLFLWLTMPTASAAEAIAALAPVAGSGAASDAAARETESRRRVRRWRRACLAVLAATLAADAGWWTYHRWFDPDLRVTFLSVGEGDAAVVRFGGGRVMLIDAGGAWRHGFDFGERIVAPYLWARKIMHVDYLVVSHPDLDHFGGMAFVARNFSPAEFWTTGARSVDASYAALMAEVAAEKIPLRIVNSAMRPERIGGATIRCLSPTPGQAETRDNNLSMVLRIAEDGRSVLFTGDLEAAGEREMLERVSGLASTVLKAPHHGSRTSSSAAFVAAVRPRVVVLSLGYRNRFHFPAPEVVARYLAAGARVLRTDQTGAVSVDLGRRPISVRIYNGRAARGAPP